jgi:hypothetical protein
MNKACDSVNEPTMLIIVSIKSALSMTRRTGPRFPSSARPYIINSVGDYIDLVRNLNIDDWL